LHLLQAEGQQAADHGGLGILFPASDVGDLSREIVW